MLDYICKKEVSGSEGKKKKKIEYCSFSSSQDEKQFICFGFHLLTLAAYSPCTCAAMRMMISFSLSIQVYLSSNCVLNTSSTQMRV